MNWVQINIQVNEDFRYMKIHIFALRWRDDMNITRTVWQTVTRITNENLGVKGLRTKKVTHKVQPSVSLMH